MALTQTVLGQVGADASAAVPAPAPSGNERYEMLALVGEGGMGRVTSARDRQFDRIVAVKELSGAAASNDAMRRFAVEAVVTGNLEHPGIVPVFERGMKDGTPYYVMRLVRGRTLTQAIAATSSLAGRLALLPAVVRVAHTLGFAHERGVVHRDVKPDNVILGAHGETVLLDWGIAKVSGVSADFGPEFDALASGPGTRAGAVVGTPAYMAPEQAQGGAVDERTDVFALGALLYHVLTGRSPYRGDTAAALITAAADARFLPVREIAQDVPPHLAAIVERAMALDPAGRYATAGQVAEALEQVTTDAVRDQGSRPRWLAGLLNAGLGAVVLMASLLLALGLVGVYLLSRHGSVSFVSLFATVVAFALAAVEYRTRGHGKLVGVGLAVALITLGVGVSQVLLGLIHTSEDLQAPELSRDVAKFLHAGAQSVGEMAYGPFSSVPLALAQVVVWALVSRRNALLEAADRRS